MGVIVDLLVSEVPQHVPRSMPLDDDDDAWAQFKWASNVFVPVEWTWDAVTRVSWMWDGQTVEPAPPTGGPWRSMPAAAQPAGVLGSAAALLGQGDVSAAAWALNSGAAAMARGLPPPPFDLRGQLGGRMAPPPGGGSLAM